jgi:hypothetical protein
VTTVWNNAEHRTFLGAIEAHIAETGQYPRSCLRCCYLEHRNLLTDEPLPPAAPTARGAADVSEFVDLDLSEDESLLSTHPALGGNRIIPLTVTPTDSHSAKPSCGC